MENIGTRNGQKLFTWDGHDCLYTLKNEFQVVIAFCMIGGLGV